MEYRFESRQADLADRVRFLGAVQLPRLIEVYQAADLFVMPSTGDGFGIAFLEAMASGTPAIGVAIARAMDALAEGELGVLVPEPNLAASLMRALRRENPKPTGWPLRTRVSVASFLPPVPVIDRLTEAA